MAAPQHWGILSARRVHAWLPRWWARCARRAANAAWHRCASAVAKPWHSPLKWSKSTRGAGTPVPFFLSGSAMPVIESSINTRSAAFAENAQAMEALVQDLREKLASHALGGNEAAREKHLARGKLLPRDRVERLLDPGSPFLEFSPL